MGCYWAEKYTTLQLHRCSRAKVNEFLLAYVYCLDMFIFGNISPACTKEYLTAATHYCQVEVKVHDQIAAVISEIIGRGGCHFPPVSCGDIISKQYNGCGGTAVNNLGQIIHAVVTGVSAATTV